MFYETAHVGLLPWNSSRTATFFVKNILEVPNGTIPCGGHGLSWFAELYRAKTTRQMTISRRKSVPKMAAGKRDDELIQLVNKMRNWTRSEKFRKGGKSRIVYGLVTKHEATANDNINDCVKLHDADVNDNIHDCVALHDANTNDHFH